MRRLDVTLSHEMDTPLNSFKYQKRKVGTTIWEIINIKMFVVTLDPQVLNTWNSLNSVCMCNRAKG